MNSESSGFFKNSYALGKLEEFAHALFVSLTPARETLSENIQYLSIIDSDDFRLERHRSKWKELQNRIIGKTKNIGPKSHPIERITVRNDTLEWALNEIWIIYEETSR